MKFISPTYGISETISDVIDKSIRRISERPFSEWIIAVGTDSQNHGSKTKFCNVILLIEKGNGGIYFYSVNIEPKIHVLQNRMLSEAEKSISIGKEIIKTLENKFIETGFDFTEHNIKIEIHCDVGENGKSKSSITSAIGWITAEFGTLVSAKIKPESTAASSVADIYTK